MKKLLLQLIAMSLAIGAFATERQALVLHMQQGDNIVYLLNTEPSVSFLGQNMLVSVGTEQNTIPMDNVIKWTVELVDDASVAQVEAPDAVRVIVSGNYVRVINPENALIEVYDIQGRLVGCCNEADAQFDLNPGIYIVKAGNKTFKIAKH